MKMPRFLFLSVTSAEVSGSSNSELGLAVPSIPGHPEGDFTRALHRAVF